jgi:NAD(P)-dependent dehydrogenase (short-subunit alcohol dehydrogenase family)
MRGALAHVVKTDVTVEAELKRLRDEALERWGGIDAWVNNAGTTYFARLAEGELASHRRVIETNLIAPVVATRLVLPIFRRQRARTFVNIGSVLSQIGQTFVPAYVISKFGLKGLSEAVRADVADVPGIHVSTVLPYAVDTPHSRTPQTRPASRPAPCSRYKSRSASPTRLWTSPHASPAALRSALHRRRLGTALVVAGCDRTSASPRAQHVPPGWPTTRHGRQSVFAPGNAGAVHGSRRPVIGRTVFALWVAGEIVRMSAGWLQTLTWRSHRAMR